MIVHSEQQHQLCYTRQQSCLIYKYAWNVIRFSSENDGWEDIFYIWGLWVTLDKSLLFVLFCPIQIFIILHKEKLHSGQKKNIRVEQRNTRNIYTNSSLKINITNSNTAKKHILCSLKPFVLHVCMRSLWYLCAAAAVCFPGCLVRPSLRPSGPTLWSRRWCAALNTKSSRVVWKRRSGTVCSRHSSEAPWGCLAR